MRYLLRLFERWFRPKPLRVSEIRQRVRRVRMRRVRRTGLAIGVLCALYIHTPGASAQQFQSRTTPDCDFAFTFSVAGTAPTQPTPAAGTPVSTNNAFDNRQVACTTWDVVYQNSGFTVVSLQLEFSTDSSGAPGSFSVWPATSVQGTLPLTSTTGTQVTAFSYKPWVRINLVTATGTGQLSGRVIGWRPWSGADATSGAILTLSASGAGSTQVQGTAAAGSPAVGNPVLVAGADTSNTIRNIPVASTGAASTSNAVTVGGQDVGGVARQLPIAVVGNSSLTQVVGMGGTDGTNARQLSFTTASGAPAVLATVTQEGATDAQANIAGSSPGGAGTAPSTFLASYNYPYLFNGTTWDRQFYCNKTVFQTAIPPSTIQIVAAVASQKIRVCSVTITRNDSAAVVTTLKFVEGTGSNCATGQTSLTGNLFSSTATAPSGNQPPSFLTGAFITNTAADALCVTTTGAASSFDVTITETQY